MSSPDVEKQDSAKDDPSKCITADDLDKKLDTNKYNKQLGDVMTQAQDFLNSYIKDQNDIKNNAAARESELQNDRYWQTALNKQRELLDKHKRMMNMLNREYDITVQVENSLINTKDLFDMLVKQNIKLKKIIEGEIHSIEISDRKTYYENEQNDWISWWANHFQNKYWLLIFLLIVGIIITKQQGDVKLWIQVALLAVYPYVIFMIIKFIVGFFNWIKSDTKWVYLYGKM
jgi:hypothetical protein